MWRWLTWAARIAATALLLSFLSIWTTGYIVNSYMETLLKQLNLPLQTQPFALSGLWGKLWGADPAPGEQAEGRNGRSLEDSRAGGQSSQSLEDSRAGRQSDRGREEAATGGQSGPGQERPPVSGQSDPGEGGWTSDVGSGASSDGRDGSTGEPDGAQTPVEEGAEGAADVGGTDGAVPVFGGQESAAMLSEEQRQALSAIMSKLNGEQLGALSGYLEDGLTPDELASVQELLKASLTEAEYAQMMEALAPGRANAGDSTETPSNGEEELP